MNIERNLQQQEKKLNTIASHLLVRIICFICNNKQFQAVKDIYVSIPYTNSPLTTTFDPFKLI